MKVAYKHKSYEKHKQRYNILKTLTLKIAIQQILLEQSHSEMSQLRKTLVVACFLFSDSGKEQKYLLKKKMKLKLEL